jgi:hypothetical protein
MPPKRAPSQDTAHPILAFPALRCVLWDRRPLGAIHLCGPESVVPKLVLPRAALASLHAHLSKNNAGVLLGPTEAVLSEVGQWSGGAFSFTAERLDKGARDAFLSPPLAAHNPEFVRMFAARRAPPASTSMHDLDPFSESEYENMVRDALEAWFRVRARFRPSQSVRMYCAAAALMGERVLVRVEALVPALSLSFQRVPRLPVLSTKLSQHLFEQSFAASESAPESHAYGLLTLNETRKAVPLLEDDPLAYRVPIVGVWMRGGLVSSPDRGIQDEDAFLQVALRDPAVWAGCVRYVLNEFLKEKVSPLDRCATGGRCVDLDSLREQPQHVPRVLVPGSKLQPGGAVLCRVHARCGAAQRRRAGALRGQRRAGRVQPKAPR